MENPTSIITEKQNLQFQPTKGQYDGDVACMTEQTRWLQEDLLYITIYTIVYNKYTTNKTIALKYVQKKIDVGILVVIGINYQHIAVASKT